MTMRDFMAEDEKKNYIHMWSINIFLQNVFIISTLVFYFHNETTIDHHYFIHIGVFGFIALCSIIVSFLVILDKFENLPKTLRNTLLLSNLYFCGFLWYLYTGIENIIIKAYNLFNILFCVFSFIAGLCLLIESIKICIMSRKRVDPIYMP
ncbi:hypothetical protein RF11_00840 [Thelohanellus kitauei]|uniref:Uncharacterized protein n=1 Tax=Thelohanellus kitauei TaxID=669202 RepID=A0A0C2NAU1_THEKT|nr:hypothetical protein RF11_00840 [Thelohanellus kitauei]